MNTRDKILETSLKLFQNEGYEKTGIQKIVDQSGITKPTLYHYFGSKKGLLQALLEESFQDFWILLRERCNYEKDLTRQLEEIAFLYFTFAKQNPVFYQWYLQLIHSPKNSDPGTLIIPVLKNQWDLLEVFFEEASADHGNMKGKSKRLTFTFLGMINTYITTGFYEQISLDQQNAFLACKQFMHGIFA